MTDTIRKRIAAAQKKPAPLTEAQERRIDCAINLYRQLGAIAATLATSNADSAAGSASTASSGHERTRILCNAGVDAEMYVANLRWLNELLRLKYDRLNVSGQETVGEWRRLYDWIVKNEIYPPILYWDGARYAPLPFDTAHEQAIMAYRAVMDFRQGIKHPTP